MADDVLAVVDDLGLAGCRGVGHSMGGTALLLAEQRRPGTFAALWLYEPIVVPPDMVRPGSPNGMAEGARRRRPGFPDRGAAFANFSSKPPLSALSDEALQAYVDHGLRDRPDGDAVELKCTPETEARVFEGSSGMETFADLGEVACPVTVAVGGEGIGPALFGPLVADALPHAPAGDLRQPHPLRPDGGPRADGRCRPAGARPGLSTGTRSGVPDRAIARVRDANPRAGAWRPPR